MRVDGSVYSLDDDFVLLKNNKHTISAVIDRFVLFARLSITRELFKQDRTRIIQALEQALKLADGLAITSFIDDPSLSFPDKPENMRDAMY